MSTRPKQLSKSRLMAARQCLKRLHLELHRPAWATPSPATDGLFRTGRAVGDIARQIYGAGRGELIPYDSGLQQALRKSARLLAEKPAQPLFEATVQYGGLLVRVDVLLPDRDGWRMVEVKAATRVKDEHLFDCAAQRWVLERCGYRLNGVALAFIDRQFTYAGDGDYRGLLTEEDVSERTAALLPEVSAWIRKAEQAAGPDEPAVGVGAHCYQPYECPFVKHCWPSGDYAVQGLAGSRAKLGEWIGRGFGDIRAVPRAELREKQARIQTLTAAGQAELLPGGRSFVDSLAWPRYYLDFETINPAVPVWAGTRPYETLPFQWSCHYEQAPGDVGHAEFLDLTGDPPMRRLAGSLIRALGRVGPVLTYTSYEKRVIADLIHRFPDLGVPLGAIIQRLVDLHPPTQQNYYHPAMAGSWSLKAVLPCIAPDMRYSELEGIQEGTAASEAYLEAIDPATSDARKAALKEQLLRYCRFDTEAMVRLVDFLANGT